MGILGSLRIRVARQVCSDFGLALGFGLARASRYRFLSVLVASLCVLVASFVDLAMLNFLLSLSFGSVAWLVALVSAVVTLVLASMLRGKVVWFLALFVAFGIAYCLCWSPVWLDGSNYSYSEFSSWAPIFITLWFLPGAGASMVVVSAVSSVRRRRANVRLSETVVFDDIKVTRTMCDGKEETLQWSDLEEVALITTNEGPFADDVYWALSGATSGCLVPSEANGAEALLAHLQNLPGFMNEVVILAMSSTENAKFVCWRKSDEA
jgi:hypothetical protein